MSSEYPTLQDLQQSKLDMKDINTFVTGEGDVFQDNTGKPRLTLQGITEQAQNAAGFQARQVQLFSSIKNLIVVDDAVLTVKGFYAGSNYGGGDFYYDPSIPKTSHNGGTIIAPEALNAWNGQYSGLAAYLNWSGSGTGCFVRKLDNILDLSCSFFGASTSVPDNRLSIQKCLNVATPKSMSAFLDPSPDFYMVDKTIFIPSGGHLKGGGGKNKRTKIKRVNGHFLDLIMAGIHTEGVNGSYHEMVVPARNGMPYNKDFLGSDVSISGIYMDGNGQNAGYAPELGSGTGYKGSNVYIRYVNGVFADDVFSEYASNDCFYCQYCRRISITNSEFSRNILTGNVIGATRNGLTVAGTLSGFSFPNSDFIYLNNIIAEETEDLGISVIFKTPETNPATSCGTVNIDNIFTRRNATYGFAIEISGADSSLQPTRDLINISNIVSVEDSQRTADSYGSVLVSYKSKNVNLSNVSIKSARSHGLILAGNMNINVSNVNIDGYGLGNWNKDMIGLFAYAVGGVTSKTINISNVDVSGGTGRTYDTYGVSITGFETINASNFSVDGNTATTVINIANVNLDCQFLNVNNFKVSNSATFGMITRVSKHFNIDNLTIINSGKAAVSGQRAGLFVKSGSNRTGNLCNSNFSDYQTTPTQNIGIVLEASSTDSVCITQCTAVGNTAQPIANLGMPKARIFNNSFPYTVPKETNESFSVGGVWNNGLRLGNSTLFVDETTWKLRIKLNGSPTSETDGVIVGTQS